MSADWFFLTKDQVCRIHDEQLDEHGGNPGFQDENMVESAVNAPQQLDCYGNPTIFEAAATYAHRLAKNHGFCDGNKRTGAASAVVFLAANGWTISDEFVQEMTDLETGKMSVPEFAAMLQRISKRNAWQLGVAHNDIISRSFCFNYKNYRPLSTSLFARLGHRPGGVARVPGKRESPTNLRIHTLETRRFYMTILVRCYNVNRLWCVSYAVCQFSSLRVDLDQR